MQYYQCYLIDNECYIVGRAMKPKGIVVHSTGANNTTLKRYVQPLPNQSIGVTKSADYMLSILGKNKYNNDWNHFFADNKTGREACVNAFIGTLADGSLAVVQTLPWDMQPWGCGGGVNGSFNNTHIQFEICEDDMNNPKYFEAAMKKAVELCSYLCITYGLSYKDVVSHQESYKLGYGSNHGDIDHWLSNFGYTMNDFRKKVQMQIEEDKPMTDAEKKEINARFEALEKKYVQIDKEIQPSVTKYQTINDVPGYAKDTINKLMGKKYLYGDNGNLKLSEQMIRIFVILDRAGMFD